MHDTKIRLNAEIASAEARSRIDTLRLHGRILRLRREKEELKSNTAKLSIENEELLDRLIKVELECCNALHQLKREKERSKLAIEAMMERALEKDKEKESLPIHRNDSKSLSFILLTAALVLALFLTSRISLRGTYTFLIDHDFITTREQRDDVAIQNSKCLEDILLEVVENENTMLHVRDAAINASSNNPVLHLLIIAVASSSLFLLL